MKLAGIRGSNYAEKLKIFFADHDRSPSWFAGIFRGVAAADAQLRVGFRRQRSRERDCFDRGLRCQVVGKRLK